MTGPCNMHYVFGSGVMMLRERKTQRKLFKKEVICHPISSISISFLCAYTDVESAKKYHHSS
jgi:hypothetical protein